MYEVTGIREAVANELIFQQSVYCLKLVKFVSKVQSKYKRQTNRKLLKQLQRKITSSTTSLPENYDLVTEASFL